MIVVAIVGILAAVAIPSFQSYVLRSRTAEAYTFLGEIRQRQEAYRAEFGQYCAVNGISVGSGTLNPPSIPSGGRVMPWTPSGGWTQLGAAPDGPVRFQYGVWAGNPGDAPTGLGFDNTDFWFVAQARGDLDGDGEQMMLETYSEGSHVFVGRPDGTMLAAGWE